MSDNPVTSLQVARRAGVSQSAVSRVFTPGGSASARTIEKVRRAAEELGYRPNVLARAMTTGRSRMIGLVVAYFENHFYPDAVERLSVALQARGYHVLVFMAAPTVHDVEGVMQEILDYQVDGVILVSVSISTVLSGRCRAAGVPVVLFNRDQDDPRLSAVTTDNHLGGRAVAAHLAGLGHRRIGYVAGFEEASTQRDREAGFVERLAELGLAPVARAVGNFVRAEAQAAARAMFARSDRPEAVFVCNDHMAFAVMDVLRSELGLRVPQDVAVAGFDDTPIAAWAAFDLTSYRQPLGRMVAEAVETLLHRIEHREEPPRRVRLEGELIVRGSTTRETA